MSDSNIELLRHVIEGHTHEDVKLQINYSYFIEK